MIILSSRNLIWWPAYPELNPENLDIQVLFHCLETEKRRACAPRDEKLSVRFGA